jgi:hypothetical protein
LEKRLLGWAKTARAQAATKLIWPHQSYRHFMMATPLRAAAAPSGLRYFDFDFAQLIVANKISVQIIYFDGHNKRRL